MHFPNLLSLAIPVVLTFTPALHAAHQKQIPVHKIGTTTLTQAKARALTAPFRMLPRATLPQMPKPIQRSRQPLVETNKNLATSLVFGGYPIVGPDKPFLGFDGIDSTDSGNATGFVVEPPDQGLATNGWQVMEVVNSALQVFQKDGKPLNQPVSVYAFFDVSTVPNKNGTSNSLADPRTFYDWESGRWFVSIVEYTLTPQGALSGGSSVLIATSDSGNPLGSYELHSVDVSDTGYGDCPCFGDQPLLGLNQDGVYLNTNEYSTSTGFFQTALVMAISKRDLMSGSSSVVAAGFDGLTVAEGVAFSVQPAFPAPWTKTNANDGTEFFTSSLDFTGTVDNRLAVWSMTNTQSLKDNVPNLNLQVSVIASEVYGTPVPAVQRTGSIPLGQALGDPEETLDPGDDRMQQLFYANGELYCGFNTILLDPKGATAPRTGAAWFVIYPEASYTTLSAKIYHQGFIGIADGSVLYPAFAVNGAGDGVIGFSLTGQNYFPSTGYVHYDGHGIQAQVHLAGIGQSPEDGFSGYPQFGGGGVARWGDYSAAMVTPDGHVWFASEYIPNSFVRPRTPYTNWGTFISQVH